MKETNRKMPNIFNILITLLKTLFSRSIAFIVKFNTLTKRKQLKY